MAGEVLDLKSLLRSLGGELERRGKALRSSDAAEGVRA